MAIFFKIKKQKKWAFNAKFFQKPKAKKTIKKHIFPAPFSAHTSIGTTPHNSAVRALSSNSALLRYKNSYRRSLRSRPSLIRQFLRNHYFFIDDIMP